VYLQKDNGEIELQQKFIKNNIENQEEKINYGFNASEEMETECKT